MDRRLQLNEIFKAMCENVYFQPPRNQQMLYPAIVYHRDPAYSKSANNKPYMVVKQYEVMLIARNPDEDIWHKLAALPMSTHDRFFVADNLNHDVFTIYF